MALVSLDPARRITEIRLQDKMESGRILLLAASLNTDASNCLHPGFGEIAMIQAADEKIPVASPTRATLMRTGDQLTLENRDLRMIADLSSGFLLREMVLLPSDRRILSHSEDVPFFTIQDSSGAWTGWSLVGYREESLSDGMMALLTWRSDQEERPGLEFQLGVAIRNEGEIQWIPTLKNLGNVPLHLDFSLPRLASVTIGAASTNSHYLLGTRNTLIAKQDVEIQQPYGGS